MAKKHKTSSAVSSSSRANDKGNEKACAILSYLLIGIIWFFADDKMKKSGFVKYHVKQGLVLLILDVIIWAIGGIPILGWIIAPILWIGFVILLIIGIINAANGDEKELPIIGKFAKNFTF
jgi:uncharacterized membrane protein